MPSTAQPARQRTNEVLKISWDIDFTNQHGFMEPVLSRLLGGLGVVVAFFGGGGWGLRDVGRGVCVCCLFGEGGCLGCSFCRIRRKPGMVGWDVLSGKKAQCVDSQDY